MSDRVILHCDCNNFFASVESVAHPEYQTVPMAVAGDPSQRHGIILAKNEKAKALGVRTAETIWQARKKCPDLLLVPPHHALYRDFSRRINDIYREYTDQVEPFSIDESWLDVTGSRRLFGDGKTIADTLRRRVRREVGVTISVGVSFNKIFAKMGSDYKKPDATTVILPEDVPRLLYPLPVGDLFGVGSRTRMELERLGLTTIGRLAEADPELLQKRLGKQGVMLSRYARGLDDDPVRRVGVSEPIKSVGNGRTFPEDLKQPDRIRAEVTALADHVASRLRRHHVKGRTVQIAVRDPMLSTVQRQTKLDAPTWLARRIADTAMELLEKHWKLGVSPIRALTVTVTDLCDADDEVIQYSLTPSEDALQTEKQEKVEKAMDRLRSRYGNDVISFGAPPDQNDET